MHNFPPYYGLRDYGVDGQIGLEATPEEYVQELVKVFQEVKRVLRNDGTLWLNLGDSYWANRSQNGLAYDKNSGKSENHMLRTGGKHPSLKPKDLIGIPWMVAFALRADGWFLRSDIIWHKPNCMPESVTDRPTKAHEYIFLLSKSERYYYDHEAIKEQLTAESIKRNRYGWGGNEDRDYVKGKQNNMSKYFGSDKTIEATDRNKRSVWAVSTASSSEAHFAVFPEKLIEPCVLAGCPIGGRILDPFGGSGTTRKVALENNRECTLIEINPDYIAMEERRTAVIQPKLF